MSNNEEGNDSFEETMREIAREVSRSVERVMDQVDLDEIAGVIGVDPDRAREWFDSAGGWLRGQVENLGEDAAQRGTAQRDQTPVSDEARIADDPLRSAGPHPLDLPTEEQGLALAALDSGRWTVEPGSNALAAQSDGPRPSDALGLAGELRARDWIAADGEVTVVGRHALKRWLEAATSP